MDNFVPPHKILEEDRFRRVAANGHLIVPSLKLKESKKALSANFQEYLIPISHSLATSVKYTREPQDNTAGLVALNPAGSATSAN